jgi:hypothetical protein
MTYKRNISVPSNGGAYTAVNLLDFTLAPTGLYSITFGSGEGNTGFFLIRWKGIVLGFDLIGGSISGNSGFGTVSVYGGSTSNGILFSGNIIQYAYSAHGTDGYGYAMAMKLTDDPLPFP